jgi:hypothetical protein
MTYEAGFPSPASPDQVSGIAPRVATLWNSRLNRCRLNSPARLVGHLHYIARGCGQVGTKVPDPGVDRPARTVAGRDRSPGRRPEQAAFDEVGDDGRGLLGEVVLARAVAGGQQRQMARPVVGALRRGADPV